jgi:hypothetical protein
MKSSRLAMLAILAILPWMVAPVPSFAQSSAADASARTQLGITVYSDGLALVRDTRTAHLSRGRQRLEFREVAATIRPETASLKDLEGSGLSLVEQNFDFDLLSPESLLSKYVGREVVVIRTNPASGVESSEQARVLAANGGIVLRYQDRIETGLAGRLSFPDVPPSLRDRPTLSMILDAANAGEHQLELTYLANQIGWKADYVANLSPDGARMTLNGWVTLTNQSGASYENARLQLVAGSLHRVAPPARQIRMALAAGKAPNAEEVAEERVGDYHLYVLPHPTTIAENQTKQLALLSAAGVPVSKEYVLESGSYEGWYMSRRPEAAKGLKPWVFLKFENKGGELGIPLPAGTVRAYAPDSAGAAQFIGEDAIPHTARGEKLALRLGQAFDLTADRVQTAFKTIGDRTREVSYRIEIRNAGPKPAAVTVRESLRGDWQIVSETQEHVKESASSAAWTVQVPADGQAVLEYTAVVGL